MRLHDYFDYFARQSPAAPFLECGGLEFSYGQGQARVHRIANRLLDAGLKTGDRIAVLSKNSAEYPILFLACSKAGVVIVPLNYRLAPPEIEYIINDANARMVLAAGEFLSAVDAVRENFVQADTFVALDGDAPPGWSALESWIADGSETEPPVDIQETDAVYQMYTSGTTGRPKGAILTHRAVTAQLAQIQVIFPPDASEKYLVVAPLYHAAAAITSFGGIAAGASLVIHSDFDPVAVVHALSDGGVARVTLVPAMIQACLLMVPDVAERSYSELRCITYGASPIAEQVLRRAIEVFGCDFAQGYGMTETTALLTYLQPEDHRRALASQPGLLLSAGRPLPGTVVRIVDGNDKEVPRGEVGEIIGYGPQLMQGYWNLAEASEQALAGGWMHTGDAGIMDEEGFLFIQDRVKDMIVSGGENVYPREIEEVLFQHPAVADAAVIGVPDDKWGESAKAIIVLKGGESAKAEEIIEFCNGRLAGYKRPRSVDFIEELPRNPSGKVLKKDLREKYWQGHTRRVS
ncbi:MAG: acyl-CoA synthetase (AMP-forming)/AMP-acid ligase II [Hyphomicrobiaceae bacterium]|jgi:acyl-CoA synthetase (AMP-forming)/AMP-acid ligase II